MLYEVITSQLGIKNPACGIKPFRITLHFAANETAGVRVLRIAVEPDDFSVFKGRYHAAGIRAIERADGLFSG